MAVIGIDTSVDIKIRAESKETPKTGFKKK
jgi:hypothetical protein